MLQDFVYHDSRDLFGKYKWTLECICFGHCCSARELHFRTSAVEAPAVKIGENGNVMVGTETDNVIAFRWQGSQHLAVTEDESLAAGR